VILVLEIVAVKEISSSISLPLHDDVDLFAIFERDRVLPARFLSEGRAAVSPQHLERHKMRARDAASSVPAVRDS
jgi:hypothetical protein